MELAQDRILNISHPFFRLEPIVFLDKWNLSSKYVHISWT